MQILEEENLELRMKNAQLENDYEELDAKYTSLVNLTRGISGEKEASWTADGERSSSTGLAVPVTWGSQYCSSGQESEPRI